MLSAEEYFGTIKDYSLDELKNEYERIMGLMEKYNAKELSDEEMKKVQSFEKPVEYFIRLEEYCNEIEEAKKGSKQHNELMLKKIRDFIEYYDPTVMSHYRNGFLQTLEQYDNYLDLPVEDKWQVWVKMAEKEINEDEIVSPPYLYDIERKKWGSGIGKYKREPHTSTDLNDFINKLDNFMENIDKPDPNEPPRKVETEEEKQIQEQTKEKIEFRRKLCRAYKAYSDTAYIDVPYDVENKRYDYPESILELKDWVLKNPNYNRDYNVSIDELMLDISHKRRDIYNFSTDELLALLVYFLKREDEQEGTIATYLKANILDRIIVILWERTFELKN